MSSARITHCLQVGAIVLAAGNASRMGKLKQLLPYGGQTLIGHAVDTVLVAGLNPVILVLGAEADAVASVVAAKNVQICRNAEWPLGMGASIHAGLTTLLAAAPDVGGVLILAGDQPLVTASHLSQMRRTLHQQSNDVVAAQYASTLGIPAAFQRRVFGRLQQLPPQSGAKALFLPDSGLRIMPMPLPEAQQDVDTPADWAKLLAASDT